MIATALWLSGLFGLATAAAAFAVAGLLRLPWIGRLHPRTRARFHAVGALLPPLLGGLVVAAIFVPHPWLGLPDHCLGHAGHLHLCLSCGLAPPPFAIAAVGALYAVWVLHGVSRWASALRSAGAALRGIPRAGERRADGVVVLPTEHPLAFVAGLLRPTVYVSRPVIAERWPAVLAHEHDHARHRDPLVRALVGIASTLSPPGLAGWFARRLATLQEIAADERAARDLGDRVEVARQVLSWARRSRRPTASVAVAAFGEEALRERIEVLMADPRYVEGPTTAQLALGSLAALALVGCLFHPIHHGAEELFELIRLG